jgi:hypothetical protein
VRKVSLGIPFNFKVVNDGSLEEGPIYVSTDSNPEYKLSVARGGDIVGKAGQTLTISNERGGNLGGYPFTVSPGASANISDFLDPFNFKYSDKESPKLFEYYTQSSDSVVSHQALKLPRSLNRYRHIKPMSFNGELYLLAQTHRVDDSNLAEIVLLKYSEQSGSFNTVKIFSEILVDTAPFVESVDGSPCSFEYDGKLHVAYRSVDRNLMTEKIVIFKMLNENDNFSWRLLNTIDITKKDFANEFNDQDFWRLNKFRLRVATHNDMSMIFFFSTYSVSNKLYSPSSNTQDTLSDVIRITVRDCRSYVSNDGFNSYVTDQKDFKGVNFIQSSEEVKAGSYSNLFNFFDISYHAQEDIVKIFPDGEERRENISEYERRRIADEYAFSDYSVNFDIYYDNNIGSFVVFKPGDKVDITFNKFKVWDNLSSGEVDYISSNYIVGIRTTEGNFNEWERFLVYPMDNSGVPRGRGESESYRIFDVSVVPGDFKNKMVLSLKFSGSQSDKSIYHSDFSFIPASIVKSDSYDSDVAIQYGVKNHPDYVFYFNGITEKSAVQSLGGKINTNLAPSFITFIEDISVQACKYRNQTICLIGGSSISILGEWGNLGEYQGYSFTHSCALSSLGNCNFAKVSNLSNLSNLFIYSNLRDKISLPTTGLFAFFEPSYLYSGFSRAEHPFSTYKFSSYFKVRFNFIVETPDQILSDSGRNFTFLEINKPGSPQISGSLDRVLNLGFKLNLYNIGDEVRLRIINLSNQVVAQSIDAVDISRDNEYLIASVKMYETQTLLKDYITVWSRPVGETTWVNMLNVDQELLRDDVGVDHSFKLGIVSRSFIPLNFSISIGSFSFSPTVFSDHGLGIDSLSYYKLDSTDRLPNLVRTSSSKTHEIKLYGNSVELHDGTLIRLHKFKYAPDRRSRELVRDPIFGSISKPQRSVQGDISKFKILRARSNNTLSNITNNYSDIGFDFSSYTNSNGFPIVIENVDRKAFNFFSLINICGVYGFTLEAGNLVNGVFERESFNRYTVPYFTLNFTSQDGNYLIVEDEYPDNQLVGYNALIYDKLSRTYLRQLFVKSNFKDIIQFNSALPDLQDKEVRLFVSSASYDVPDSVSSIVHSYVRLNFFSPNALNLAMIGEVAFGNLLDISDVVGSYSETLSDSSSSVQSSKGLYFPSFNLSGPIQESAQISLTNIFEEGRFKEVMYSLTDVSKSEMNFPMVVISEEGWVTQYGGIKSGFSSSPTSYTNQVDFSVDIQNWEHKTFSDKLFYPPVVTANASETEVVAGQNIVIFANIYDPQNQFVSITWFFEDGTQAQGLSVSKSFSLPGTYSVRVQGVNESGLVSQYILPIVVKAEPIAYYDVSYTQPLYSNQNTLLYLTAKDRNGNTVFNDNSTTITFYDDSDPSSLVFDINRDGIYTSNYSDMVGRLSAGSFELRLRSNSGGIKLLRFEDEFGNSSTLELDFEIGVEIIADLSFNSIANADKTLQAKAVAGLVFDSLFKANIGQSSSSVSQVSMSGEVTASSSIPIEAEGEIIFKMDVDATYDIDAEIYSESNVSIKLDLIRQISSKFESHVEVVSNVELIKNLRSNINSDLNISARTTSEALISLEMYAGTDVFKDIESTANVNALLFAESLIHSELKYFTSFKSDLASSSEVLSNIVSYVNIGSNFILSSNLDLSLSSMYSVQSNLDSQSDIYSELNVSGPANKSVNTEGTKRINTESGLIITIE